MHPEKHFSDISKMFRGAEEPFCSPYADAQEVTPLKFIFSSLSDAGFFAFAGVQPSAGEVEGGNEDDGRQH
jgi:hypothetical protein